MMRPAIARWRDLARARLDYALVVVDDAALPSLRALGELGVVVCAVDDVAD